MPCYDGGGPSPDPFDMQRQIDTLRAQVARLETNVYSSEKARADLLADMLCWVIRRIPEAQRTQFRPDIQEWWKAHEAWDKARNA